MNSYHSYSVKFVANKFLPTLIGCNTLYKQFSEKEDLFLRACQILRFSIRSECCDNEKLTSFLARQTLVAMSGDNPMSCHSFATLVSQKMFARKRTRLNCAADFLSLHIRFEQVCWIIQIVEMIHMDVFIRNIVRLYHTKQLLLHLHICVHISMLLATTQPYTQHILHKTNDSHKPCGCNYEISFALRNRKIGP